jgi:hypothetical protein
MLPTMSPTHAQSKRSFHAACVAGGLFWTAWAPAALSQALASVHQEQSVDQAARDLQDQDDVPADAYWLLTRDGGVAPVSIASITDQSLVHMDEARGWVTLELNQCIALLSAQAGVESLAAEAEPGSGAWNQAPGLLVLATGERLPGQPALDAPPQADALGWNHPWLGRVDVPLKLVELVLLQTNANPPDAGEADVILLGNGDVRQGLVTAIGDPVTIEIMSEGGAGGNVNPVNPTTRQTLDIPLSRIVAIRMIAPRQPGQGKRVWFNEGTVLDVQSLVVNDNGLVRLSGGVLAAALPQAQVGMGEISAVLFDRSRMLALSSMSPSRVEGPSTRYTLPRPTVLNPRAPLGLSSVEFSGPITVRYALPAGCERFIAEAELPREDRAWGDCDLIVRSDDTEVFRTRVNRASPMARINAMLPAKAGGRELTIEITEGARGPIQDRVRLHRPLLLKGK